MSSRLCTLKIYCAQISHVVLKVKFVLCVIVNGKIWHHQLPCHSKWHDRYNTVPVSSFSPSNYSCEGYLKTHLLLRIFCNIYIYICQISFTSACFLGFFSHTVLGIFAIPNPVFEPCRRLYSGCIQTLQKSLICLCIVLVFTQYKFLSAVLAFKQVYFMDR